jgi:hypothetical protein
MLKSINISIAVLSLTVGLASAITLAVSPSVSAKTLVVCGPKGASFIVDIVPAGCRVLSVASPPMQAGNAVAGSALGSYFTASAPHRTVTANERAIAMSRSMSHF